MNYSDVIESLMDRQPQLIVRSQAALVAVLRFNYHVMLASAPLLDLAAELAHGALFEGDADLARYFDRHADEERDHADWLREDIHELGEGVQGPDHVAACIAGAQYYYLNHLGPVPFLGYLAAMEFRPMTLADVARAGKLTGGKGLRTLRHHAAADVEHGRALAAVIDHYRTDQLIAYNAVMTHNMYMTYARARAAEAVAVNPTEALCPQAIH